MVKKTSKKKNQNSGNLSKTGIDIIGDAPWGTHFCLFYKTKKDLTDILVPYFKAGLENNEFCMWVTSEPLKVEDTKRSLRKAVKNLDEYIEKGQMEILDYSQWYNKTGKFDADKVLKGWVEKEKQAIEKGFDGLRLADNTFWIDKKDWKSFVDYKVMVNNVIHNYKMLAICSYPLDKCAAPEILDVFSMHQFAIINRNGKWTIIESTELKMMEEEIIMSRKKYRKLAELLPGGVFEIDLNGKFTYANRLAFEMAGYTRNDLEQGLNALQMFITEERERVRNNMKLILTGQKSGPHEYMALRKDGTTYSVSIYSSPILNEKGNPVGLRGIIIDITESKQAEETLRASEVKHRTLLDNLPQKIFLKDKNSVYISCNENYARDLKIKPEEIVGKTDYDFYPKDLAEKYRADDKRIMESGKTEDIEEKYIQDKEERFVHTTKTPIKDAQGNVVGILGIFWDITTRKKTEETLRESEEKYRVLVENSPNFVAIYQEGTLKYVNKAMCERLGWTFEEMTSASFNPIEKIIPQRLQSQIRKNIAKRLRGEGISPYEISIKVRDGSEIPAIVKAQAILYGGKLADMVIHIDITERKQAEEELKNSHEELRAFAARLQFIREEERTVIAREIHDEIGQALTALKMDIAWLINRLPREEKSLLEKTKSMSKLLETTSKTMKRISSELRPGLLDDLGLLAAIEWYTGEFQNRTGIPCKLTIEPEEISLKKDLTTAIFRILQETLTNVAHHANATKVTVNLLEKDGTLKLKVRDNGKGITEKQISSSKSFGLVGIRERVYTYGGEVKIKGTPGKGTTVMVKIPIMK